MTHPVTPPPMLTARFDEALAYASRLHRDQRRKGTTIPYVAHLLGVASIALENGADEDQAIAALLHDAVEDQGGLPRLAEIRARCGARCGAWWRRARMSRVPPTRTGFGTPSDLSPSLVQAYQHAIYGFAWPMDEHTEFALDTYVEPLDAIFQIMGHATGALITAANPVGVAQTDAVNEQRHRMLVDDMKTRGFRTIAAYGRDPAGEWPREDGLLILGLSFETALAIGVAHGQNAIVWSDETVVPRLVLLR